MGDGLDDPFAHPQPGQQHKENPGEKNHPQSRLPGHPFAEDQGIGEKGVEPHAGSHHQRRVGPQGDEQGGQTGHQAGDGGQRALVHPSLGKNVGVDEDDVGGGEKSGDAGGDLGAHIGAARMQVEKLFQHKAPPWNKWFFGLTKRGSYTTEKTAAANINGSPLLVPARVGRKGLSGRRGFAGKGRP